MGLRLEQWRNEQGGRRRKPPEALWAEAARLGERFGFAPVAAVLRMNATELRRNSVAPGPRFVELVMPAAAGECALEMETARGKMRLEMRAMPVMAMAQLVRAVTE